MPAVQMTYGTRIRPALNGMLADTVGASIAERILTEPNGAGFGIVVSQDPTMDRGVRKGALGGTAIGVLVRDVTMDGTLLIPVAGTRGTVDMYDANRTVPVVTRGRVWVVADSNTTRNGNVYYDSDTGLMGGSSSGRAATGTIKFTSVPVNGDTLTINGVAFTWIASGTPSSTQALINPTSLGLTLENMVTTLNASANGSVSPATYALNASSPDHEAATEIHVSYDTVGTAGNAFTLATTVAGTTLSGSTLAGGGVGDKASDSIVFTVNPANTKKIVLNGTNVVFKTSPGAGEVQIGGDLATTLASLKTLLNASADTEIAKNVYDVTGGTTLTIVSKTTGTTMNAYTVTTDVSGATVTTATMTGGEPDTTQLVGARWLETVNAGELVQISLSMQI